MHTSKESRYRILLKSITSPVLALISDLTIFFCNDAYAQLIDKSIDELEGKNLLDILPAIDKTIFYSTVSEVLETGEVGTFEDQIGQLHFHTKVHPTPWGIIAIYRDLTNQKTIEQEVKESELRFRTMIEQFPVGIMIHHLDGHILFGNQAVKDLWAFSPEQYQDLLENYNILKDEHLKNLGLMPLIRKGFSGETISIPTIPYNVYGTFKSVPKKNLWLRSQLHPMKSEDGTLREIIHVQQDVSEQTQIERKLRQERDRAQQYLDIIPVIMIAIDLNGIITMVNKKGCDTFGYQEPELLGQNYFEKFVPERITFSGTFFDL